MPATCRLAELLNHGAAALTLLLAMPVKLEGSGSQRRMLEVVLSAGTPVKAVLAFRDDPDRQGESGDVVPWPGRADPRYRQLLHSLLSGLGQQRFGCTTRLVPLASQRPFGGERTPL